MRSEGDGAAMLSVVVMVGSRVEVEVEVCELIGGVR